MRSKYCYVQNNGYYSTHVIPFSFLLTSITVPVNDKKLALNVLVALNTASRLLIILSIESIDPNHVLTILPLLLVFNNC